MQIKNVRKMQQMMRELKIINVEELKKEELGTLLTKLSNGENIMPVLQTTKVTIKNIRWRKQQKM